MQYKNKNLYLTKNLGEIIKNERIKNANISLSKLAYEYDINKGGLSKIENGLVDCKFTTLWKIAEALGMKYSELVILVEEKIDKDFKLIDE